MKGKESSVGKERKGDGRKKITGKVGRAACDNGGGKKQSREKRKTCSDDRTNGCV